MYFFVMFLVFVTDKFSGGGKPGTGIIKIGRNGVTVVVRPEIYVVSQTVFFKPGLHLLGKGGCLERFVQVFFMEERCKPKRNLYFLGTG